MQRASGASRTDLYRTITDTLIMQIEAGAGTCRMPWHHDGSPANRPTNALSHAGYRGINVFALWAAAQAAGYPSGTWATYRQWGELGAQVRKGQRGTLVVFWKSLDEQGAYTENDDDRPARRMVARGFRVFNAAQVDGYVPPAPPPLPETERISRAEQFYARLGIDTRFGGNEARYVPREDCVHMPPFERFTDAVAFYGVLFHEGAHASGAPHRLDRDLTGRFGSEAYAMEEMIAEWASCMTCMTLELGAEPRPDHAHYIRSWLTVLKSDPRAVFTAASKAQEIVDWMWMCQPSFFHAAGRWTSHLR